MPTPSEIVGVLGDVRNISVSADAQPAIYVPWAQLPWADVHLIARAAAGPLALAGFRSPRCRW